MNENENENEFDFTDDSSADTSEIKLGDDYDPRPQEDTARRNIAYLLIGLLWLIVGAIFVLTAFGSIKLVEIKEFAVILGPVYGCWGGGLFGGRVGTSISRPDTRYPGGQGNRNFARAPASAERDAISRSEFRRTRNKRIRDTNGLSTANP